MRSPPSNSAMKSRNAGGALPWLLAALATLIAISRCGGSDNATTATPQAPPAPDAGARGACGIFIERLARNPASVQLVDQPGWRTVGNADGTWSVLATYRAQNGFGGMNLERSTCVMRKSASGDWSLLTVSRMQ